MKERCTICNCRHTELIRVRILYLTGSNDDHICERCRLELSKFARSLQRVADKVRYDETEITKKESKK